MKYYTHSELAREAGLSLRRLRRVTKTEATPGGALDGHYVGTGSNMVFKRTALVPLFIYLRRQHEQTEAEGS